jgi:hypothetical protein
MSKRVTSVAGAVALVTAAVVGGTGTAAAAPTGQPTVVVSGLNNPRQLSLVGGFELLIAEAGDGGSTVVGSGPNAEYVGTSGAVSAVLNPAAATAQRPRRILTGFLSGAGKGGVGAVGSDGVSAHYLNGPIYVQETYAPPDQLPAPLPGEQSGHLLHAEPGGAIHLGANITRFERLNDPDGQGFDSDPYAVLDMGASTQLVADAAGNDVLTVKDGVASLFHVFPNVTTGACATMSDPHPPFAGCNYVPTSLATDGAGNVYVGGLVSEVRGAGQVTELSSSGAVLRTWKGFSSVDGVAVGSDGSLYVSQLEGKEANPVGPGVSGVLTRIAPDGSRTNVDVPFAGGVAADDAGNVFVSAFAIAPATGLGVPGIDTSGQVWRLHF